MIFYFLKPMPDGSIYSLPQKGKDVHEVFRDFRDLWWSPDMTGTFAVFQGESLVARCVPGPDKQTGEPSIILQSFKP